jgi:hypothetical protein
VAEMFKRGAIAPDWILQLFDELDALDFGTAFERFTADTELEFGTARVKGAEAMKAFFINMDSSLNVKHHILEYWYGRNVRIVRGDIFLSSKDNPSKVTTAPMVNIFYMLKTGSKKIVRVETHDVP